MNKKNITIIATGGTIAGRGSVGKSANYQAGTFDVEEIVQSIPQIRDLANLNTIQLYNCLLYTSPSPRDLSTSRMPSSA